MTTIDRNADPADARIVAFGESATLVEIAHAPGRDASRRIRAVAAEIAGAGREHLRSVTPGLTSVLVQFDPLQTTREVVEGIVRAGIHQAGSGLVAPPRHRTIPVVYGGEHGPDLGDVSEITGLSEAEVVARHAAASLEVYLLGFAPGFPYLGDLPEEIDVPRLATPRTRTPAGSVAITGRYSGIYPAEAPGGWRVIGRTPLRLFDPDRDPPAYLLPGDEVTFRPIDAAQFDALDRVASDW